MAKMPGRTTDITLRAQALALLEEGIPLSRIMKITSYSKFSIYRIKKSLMSKIIILKSAKSLKMSFLLMYSIQIDQK